MSSEGERPRLSGSSPRFLGQPTGLSVTGRCLLPPSPTSHLVCTCSHRSNPVCALEFPEYIHSSNTCVLTHGAPSVCNASPSVCLNNSYSSFKTHLRAHFPSKPCLILSPGEMICFSHVAPRSLIYHNAYHPVRHSLIH